MATYYLDFLNGNDAAAGNSWASAWKTAQNGPTAARIAPGDIIRVAKSPNPVSVGTATWTSNKIGNSITFSTAPTKFITGGTAGWVTSSTTTVTNNQTTAYILNGTVSCVTSADTALMYKNLGSTIDYSAHRQLSFWFRTGSAFDCTGAQNMTIQLCSDTAGAVVVDSIVMPKWNYSANYWYPITVDKGSAFGSNIQSISIVTTSATTQTFYFDEFFASPANGITLQSLIGKDGSSATEQNDWYMIKTIRDADVWLMASYGTSSAAGAMSSGNGLDCSYVGTTETVTTYRRETIKPHTTGPTSTAFIMTNEAGNVSGAPIIFNTFSGGWNTSTDLQDGETWLDNLIQLNTGIAANSNSSGWKFEKFGLVRCSSGFTGSSSNPVDTIDLSYVANASVNYSIATPNMLFPMTVSIKTLNGNAAATVSGASFQYSGVTVNCGNCWGNSNVSIGNLSQSIFNVGDVTGSSSSSACLSITSSGFDNVFNIGNIRTVLTTANPTAQSTNLLSIAALTDSVINAKNLTLNKTNGALLTTTGISNNVILNAESYNSNVASCTLFNGNNTTSGITLNGGSIVISGKIWPSAASTVVPGGYMIINNYNNTHGYSRIYVPLGNNDSAYYELQSTDVYTPGTNAWKVSLTGLSADSGTTTTLSGVDLGVKLASAAVNANKLVTVTARVKRSSANHDIGIRIDGLSRFIPGYTSDIIALCTSSGSYELLTLTFTPTNYCVFDVYSRLKLLNNTSCDIVWADLTISQAT